MVDCATGFAGLELSRVGLGTWAMGGDQWAYGWGHQEDKDSISTIRRALDFGINWIDTAGVYGLGRAESVIAEALSSIHGRGRRPYLFTKCGFAWEPEAPLLSPRRVGSPRELRKQVDDSLRRLRIDQIDLCFMHWPPEDGTPIDEYWSALLQLKREGKIAYAGLSNHSMADVQTAHAIGKVDCVQLPFSITRRVFSDEDLLWCQREQIGVLVYSPLQSGLLTGTFDLERLRTLPATDWRSRSSQFAPAIVERTLAVVEVLRLISVKRNVSVAAVAVAWTLESSGVSGAIVGARMPNQMDLWRSALALRLTAEDLDDIRVAKMGLGF